MEVMGKKPLSGLCLILQAAGHLFGLFGNLSGRFFSDHPHRFLCGKRYASFSFLAA